MSSPGNSLHPSDLPTIGMLTALLSGPTEINLWHGVADRARERNANLVCFSGGIPHWQQQYEYQKNILFQIAGGQNVDGMLIWSTILSHTLDPDRLKAFCQRYSPLPMISMGMLLPSIPSIQIDMRDGMIRLLSHLIEVHGRRKIAFLRGLEVSQDAEDRFQAYRETLAQYGLPFDPNRVVTGDFRRDSAIAAVQQLMEDHKPSFDTLVAANDNMAIGAMQALQARGIRIPDDVIVTGFDDIEETAAVVPSLTTVRAPWYILGHKSIDLILSKLAGAPLPDQVILPTELVFRESCGCQDQLSLSAANVHSKGNIEIHSAGSPTPRPPASALSTRLIESFIQDIQSHAPGPGSFFKALEEHISTVSSGTEVIVCQEALDEIRQKVAILFYSQEELLKAHTLLERGYAAIGEVAHRRELHQRLEEENQTDRLNRIMQTMLTTYDIETLMRLLALELPGLGIQTCFISLYDEKGEPPALSRLILACFGSERIPLNPGGIRFPTQELVPAGFFPMNRRVTFDVEALYFQEEQIGFVLFEIGPRDGNVYTTLRGHISSALMNARLVQVALEAEAKAIKADQLKTHLLMNVSHELRTPINIILGLSQEGLSSPAAYGIELPPQLLKDLEYIYNSGEHLVRLINDLLDMSRAEIGELDLCFELVSPRSLMKETFDTFIGSPTGKKKDVNVSLEIPEHLPILQADPVRLRQILMNLLSNAVKFTRRGKILLGAEVQLPHLHIWVADTGSGISPELQERIFEPFVKADPPGRHREGIGLGLSITRRLVLLHGGSITLDSQPGQGSTFHVYIPLPGLTENIAKEVHPESMQPVLLWLSANQSPAETVQHLCHKNGFEVRWLGSIDDLEGILRKERPAALAWDLDHSRPGDWSIIQRLRSYAQYSQLPLLLFQDKVQISGGRLQGEQVTNVLLKPAGKQMLQNVLNLIPQTRPHGEIWIIDDDPQALVYYQELVSRFLSEYLVRTVKGGREALDLLADKTPDLVLLDLMMPDLDGFQVLEQIRSNPKSAAVPVIILTGRLLSYEDVSRLDTFKVTIQTKGILSSSESTAEMQRILASESALPQPTTLLVKQALSYIQQNYTRAFTLVELSETLGVSKSYLSRIFKIDTGIALWDYLNRYRILKAKEHLLLTNESITEIAGNVGYEDVGYFSRVFRKITGCSPREFRQQPHKFSLPD